LEIAASADLVDGFVDPVDGPLPTRDDGFLFYVGRGRRRRAACGDEDTVMAETMRLGFMDYSWA
jgi:hypothetical protein